MAKARRTTHRSTAGTKLYAVRDASGKFKDIQTYKRAQGADVRTKSAAERTTAARKTAARKKKA
jgi:DNA-binding protein HU-beta